MPINCQQCDGTIHPYENMVVLKHLLWLSIAQRKEMLCPACIELRLGRPIRLADLLPSIRNLKQVPCNQLWLNRKPPCLK